MQFSIARSWLAANCRRMFDMHHAVTFHAHFSLPLPSHYHQCYNYRRDLMSLRQSFLCKFLQLVLSCHVTVKRPGSADKFRSPGTKKKKQVLNYFLLRIFFYFVLQIKTITTNIATDRIQNCISSSGIQRRKSPTRDMRPTLL